MKLKKLLLITTASAIMTLGTVASSFAAGLGTINPSALLQQHPRYAKAMQEWQKDVKSAQEDFQKEMKKTKDPKAQQALAQKYNARLNQQRISLFTPLEKDILLKTQAVQKEKGLDYIVLSGSVIIGQDQAQDITKEVAAKLK